jgi:hypothetical protein
MIGCLPQLSLSCPVQQALCPFKDEQIEITVQKVMSPVCLIIRVTGQVLWLSSQQQLIPGHCMCLSHSP